MLAMEENVSKYTNAIGSGKQAITQGQKRKGGRGMREGWEYKKLGEVASSELGKTLNKSKDTGKLYPYICAVNVLWDMIDLTILKHAFFEKEEIDRYSVRKGDLLVCEGGDTGRSAIWEKEEPVLYQNAIHRVRFTTEMEARFAMYCLWHLKNNGQIDQKYSKGVTIKHLVKSSLLSIELPVPPLSTQHTIVSELDKINELIRLKKEQLKDYDNLAQSIFYEMFGDPVVNEKGWEVKKLGDVCKFTQGTQVPIEEQHLSKENGLVQFLRIIDFTQGKDAPRFVKCSNDKYILHEHEIAIVRYGTPGFVCYGKIGAIANNLFKITPNQKDMFEFEFLVHWLNTEAFQSAVKSKQYGAALQAIKFSTIQGINIIIPSLTVQRSFATRISQIDKQKQYIEESIKELESLLASRMQYWFD